MYICICVIYYNFFIYFINIQWYKNKHLYLEHICCIYVIRHLNFAEATVEDQSRLHDKYLPSLLSCRKHFEIFDTLSKNKSAKTYNGKLIHKSHRS